MTELSKTYEARETEGKWYQFWEDNGLFIADPHSDKPPFSLVMPPPNVTGVLHMGHVLGNTLQDIICRWKRMQGFEVLWVPGTDHAGIATQTVVEKHLQKNYGKGRKDYSREEFLSHIWEWKENHLNRIIEQIKRLGCSCDWSRMKFTMDDDINYAVKTIFKKLYEDGLIYRGDYLVNWDPITQTALADDEVEYEEKMGHLWYIRYPLVDLDKSIIIATTRPETLLGDTAVAVSMQDPRYKDLIGKMIAHPITNRLIPVIADHYVDSAFGTGAVKITPAHDPNDYEIGLRHNLPFINIMNPNGTLNDNGLQFEGMTMAEARGRVIEELKKQGFLEKIEEHPHRVGVSYRSKAVIEPYLSKQWFIRMKGFAENLCSIVKNQDFSIAPSNWESTYFHWLENVRDWCISRQLWWGHRIPIWYHKTDPNKIICHVEDGLPEEVTRNPSEWQQDEDVLDTWFSSALWPFSTLGWPHDTAFINKFYPLSLMITGNDILFFWVARMLLMGSYAMNALPFPKALLTGLIFGKSYWRKELNGSITYVSQEERQAFDAGEKTPKDVFSKWEKISKSKGNAIDPLEIIAEYGTDAMRMALASSPLLAHQIDLDRRKFEEFKNFSNKVWNGARFVCLNLLESEQNNSTALHAMELAEGLDNNLLAVEDRWILSRLVKLIDATKNNLEAFQIDKAALEVYEFFWNEFCAYYVEMIKPTLFGKVGTLATRKNKQKLLTSILLICLRLMHPITPFITEEIFQYIKNLLGPIPEKLQSDPWTMDACESLNAISIMVAPYPLSKNFPPPSEPAEKAFEEIERTIYTIRNIRGEMRLSISDKTMLYIIGDPHDALLMHIETNKHLLLALTPSQEVHFVSSMPSFALYSSKTLGSIEIVIPLPENLIQKEKDRLEKELLKIDTSLQKLQAQLDNPLFLERAPEELVNTKKQDLSSLSTEKAEIIEKLKKL